MSKEHLIHLARAAAMIFVVSMLACLPSACKNDDLWNEVPDEITDFINQYYPFSKLESVTTSGTDIHIRLDNGPGMTFDSDYNWISVDGYGMPLPQSMLFDQLPPKLYDYLQASENLNDVFSMQRDDSIYTLTLLDTSLYYDVETGELTTRKDAL